MRSVHVYHVVHILCCSYDGLRELSALVIKHGGGGKSASSINRCIDTLNARLGDGNLKVNVLALELARKVAEGLGDAFPGESLPGFVSAVATNLAATNGKVAKLASQAVDALGQGMDPQRLCQPFANVAGE